MDTVTIGGVSVSRFILGSNPFSGFSHQGHERDAEMVHHYTCARIKDLLSQAERLGINTVIARGDHHIIRVLTEYWDEGGKLQWFCQTCPEVGHPDRTIRKAADVGASGLHIHGGYADHLFAHDRQNELKPSVELAQELGLVTGLAGHNPAVHEWAQNAGLPLDFHMCSYYNPIPREKSAEHRAGTRERYRDEDRDAMVQTIERMSTPVVHYKVMAAGRNDPVDALTYVAEHLRESDAVCVGIFTGDNPDMLVEDVDILEGALARQADLS